MRTVSKNRLIYQSLIIAELVSYRDMKEGRKKALGYFSFV